MINAFQKFSFERRRITRLLFFLILDIFFIFLAVLMAFFVRFEGQIPSQYFVNILGIFLFACLITLPIFYFFKLYYFTWLYVSTTELLSLLKASLLSFLLLTSVFFILKDYAVLTGFPRSTLFISYFFIFVFSGGIRFAKRIFLQILPQVRLQDKKMTLIVGAGDAGEQILRSISNVKTSPYFPIGFVDDNLAKQGSLIHGIKVLGKIKDIALIAKAKKVESLIIALPTAGSHTIRLAVEEGRKAGIRRIKIVPSIADVIDGKIGLANLREVRVGDLLGREQVPLDQKLVDQFIKGKPILITGGAGSIGSELCRQVARFRPSLLLILDQDETGVFNISEELKLHFPYLNIVPLVSDIQDERKVAKIFEEFKPKAIFHAAAYKHVPLMEIQPDEAVKNNILGLKTVAQNAINQGAENFIFISTDKAVNPTSVMGGTKRIGEMICQSQNSGVKFVSVRFGNVLDSRGSVIPIFREQIKKGGPVEITHPEMKRYFMTTPEACLLVMQAGAMGQGGEVFVLDMGEPIKIVDLAREMIRLSGFEPDKDIPIVFTEPRPGEKFFEEILTAEEGIVATQNKKIFIAKLSAVDKAELNNGLARLKEAAEIGDKETIVKIFNELIPHYGQKIS